MREETCVTATGAFKNNSFKGNPTCLTADLSAETTDQKRVVGYI